MYSSRQEANRLGECLMNGMEMIVTVLLYTLMICPPLDCLGNSSHPSQKDTAETEGFRDGQQRKFHVRRDRKDQGY